MANSDSKQGDCGCRKPHDGKPRNERESVLRRERARRVSLRPSAETAGAALVLRSPGFRAVVAPVGSPEPSDVTPEQMAALERQLPDWTRLPVDARTGAIDVRLEDLDGAHVKSGSVVLEGDGRALTIPLDPTTRRFRLGGLEPGPYSVRGASTSAGRGVQRVVVRPHDVTRSTLKLDGSAVTGRVSGEIPIQGVHGASVHVRATDRLSGKVVFDAKVPVRNGRLAIAGLATGALHLDFSDDSGAKSCYDVDVIDHIDIKDYLTVQFPELDPIGPIADPFDGLSPRFNGLKAILTTVGIRTMRDLSGRRSRRSDASSPRLVGVPRAQDRQRASRRGGRRGARRDRRVAPLWRAPEYVQARSRCRVRPLVPSGGCRHHAAHDGAAHG